MRKINLFLFLILPIYSYADCNHAVVDHDSRLACVTVVNNYSKNLSITGYPGFVLKSGFSEETMLLIGAGGLVQMTPNPYLPYDDDKQLKCTFKVSQAKATKIAITFSKDSYTVDPDEFKDNCVFQKL